KALGGYAWELAGRAWYDTVCDKELPQDADFKTFAQFTIRHAETRFNKATAQAIEEAWKETGVLS
ncbi:MAG: M4 family metallopeptidase, partial [Mixta calida]|nr:M4 family metallopeptidase [Mixta calida]